ncbi:hypothetical protein PPL_00768 [Heterostelium album PN500]|uniref:Uncharacterized protein n=1 Tax=Heterostelium pallidum (strain ATCC 26659 / Pp 5 / PN500) TaxID=670386 RepID=D3AXD7_HETP5|nr:hypothetical protein PPL_00768 [Heterostelium album PN500]EFA86206.1 hypothetical protein PPL_00768 [Heterostelium album PN500]|eukprot:XP_020438311.1 hypothetical protein PPL_00768 [Heterostelium album PN500]
MTPTPYRISVLTDTFQVNSFIDNIVSGTFNIDVNAKVDESSSLNFNSKLITLLSKFEYRDKPLKAGYLLYHYSDEETTFYSRDMWTAIDSYSIHGLVHHFTGGGSRCSHIENNSKISFEYQSWYNYKYQPTLEEFIDIVCNHDFNLHADSIIIYFNEDGYITDHPIKVCNDQISNFENTHELIDP